MRSPTSRDVGRKRELTSEGLEVLRRALANREVGTAGFTIQPPAGDFTERIWQAVFSAAGAGYAAKAGSNLLLNRAAYGAATLADGLASFDTTIYREVEAGDHTIVLLRLHAVEHADDSLPLVFHRSGFGRLQHPA